MKLEKEMIECPNCGELCEIIYEEWACNYCEESYNCLQCSIDKPCTSYIIKCNKCGESNII